MSTVLSGNKQEISLVDEALAAEKSGNYTLSVLLGAHSLQLSVHCSIENRFLALIAREVKEGSLESAVRVLGDLQKEFPWMAGVFRKKIITWLDGNFTLVPAGLFSAGEASSYIGLACANGLPGEIQHRPLHSMNAVMAWKKPAYLNSPGTLYLHQSFVTVEAITGMNKNRSGRKVYAITHNGTLELCVMDGSSLMLYNIFGYDNTDELVYYVMNAYESLGLNPEDVPLFLSGDTGKNSAAWMLFYKYIRHIDLVSMPGHYSFSYKIAAEEPGRFFSLFSQVECAS